MRILLFLLSAFLLPGPSWAKPSDAERAERIRIREELEAKQRKAGEEFLGSLQGKALRVSSKAETRTCRYSHRAEGGGAAFACPGNPGWLLAVNPSMGQVTWTLIGAEPANGEPRRLLISGVDDGEKLLYAENPSGNFLSVAPPDDASWPQFPRLYREFLLLTAGLVPLKEPFGLQVLPDGSAKGSYNFSPAQGEVVSAEFRAIEAPLLETAERRIAALKAEMNPAAVRVKLENGRELSCRRGNPVETKADFIGGAHELSCELFSCEGFSEGGEKFDSLLHFNSDITRQVTNGPGTEGPFLFSLGDHNDGASFAIQSISTSASLLYEAKGESQSGLAASPDLTALAKAAGVGSVIQEMQVPHYRAVLEMLGRNCRGIDPAWAKLQNHYRTVRSLTDKQDAFLLVEKVGEVLKSRLVPASDIDGDVCRLESGTFVRIGAVAALHPAQLQSFDGKAVDEQTAQKLFRLVAEMKDVHHEFSAYGCEARAHIVAERLRALGYDVQKIWATGGNLSPYRDQSDTWQFHVAAAILVRDKNGAVSWKVIDPTLAAHAVSPHDWLRRFQPTAEGNAVWTRWPLPGISTQGLAKTLVYLSPPEVFLPGEVDLPDQARSAESLASAKKTVAGIQRTLEAVKLGGSVPVPLVNREE